MNRVFAAAALVTMVACGGSSNNTGSNSNPGNSGNPGGSGGACSITLSGAMTGAYDCAGQAATGIWSSSDNIGALVLYGPSSDSNISIGISVGARGQLHTGTFSSTDSSSWGIIRVIDGNVSSIFSAFADGSQPGSNYGSYTVNLTSVTQSATSGDTTLYNVHGTMSATLPSDLSSAGTGTVTLRATF